MNFRPQTLLLLLALTGAGVAFPSAERAAWAGPEVSSGSGGSFIERLRNCAFGRLVAGIHSSASTPQDAGLNRSAALDVDKYDINFTVRAVEAVSDVLHDEYRVNGKAALIITEDDGHRRIASEYEYETSQLKPGDTVVESGAGLGLHPLELARTKGVNGVAISVHDFWPTIQRLARSLRPADLKYGKTSFIGQIGPFNFVSLRYLGKQVGIRYYATLSKPELVKRAKIIFSRLIAMRADQEKRGLFSFQKGYAETILPKLKTKARLISDIHGAVFYSEKRATLLEDYYNGLTADGKAFVVIGHSIDTLDLSETAADEFSKANGTRAWDYVLTKNGQKIPLYEYLVKKYPTIFSMKTSVSSHGRAQWLVVQRDPNIQHLDLGLDRDTSQVEFKGNPDGEYNFPTNVIYRER